VIWLIYRQVAANVPFIQYFVLSNAKWFDLIFLEAYNGNVNARAWQKHQQRSAAVALRSSVDVARAKAACQRRETEAHFALWANRRNAFEHAATTVGTPECDLGDPGIENRIAEFEAELVPQQVLQDAAYKKIRVARIALNRVLAFENFVAHFSKVLEIVISRLERLFHLSSPLVTDSCELSPLEQCPDIQAVAPNLFN
jgi:hypothetical protein